MTDSSAEYPSRRSRPATRDRPPARGRDRRLVARSDVRRDGRPGQQHGAHRGRSGQRQRARRAARGVAGLLAGAFSMALGEYTSVTTANEQLDSEVRVERRSFRKHPQAERAELVAMLVDMGMTHGHRHQGHRRDSPRRDPGAELPPGSGARHRPTGEAVAVDGGRVVIPVVRDRCRRPADSVSWASRRSGRVWPAEAWGC